MSIIMYLCLEAKCLRKRQGCSSALKQIKFYDEEGFHIVGFSENQVSEIVDFSVLREDMTAKISQVMKHSNSRSKITRE
jgi:hypothetical protein